MPPRKSKTARVLILSKLSLRVVETKRSLLVIIFGFHGVIAVTSCDNKESRVSSEIGATPKPQLPVPATVYTELAGRPADQEMNTAQKEFWDYLEEFNRLPENPTEEMKKMFETKGVAPDFIYLTPSETSVFGNLEGAESHREVFAQRYPWVKNLIEKYQITLEVDKNLFSGTTQEILKKYDHYTETDLSLSDRPLFTKQWLECLLILDYVYSYGSKEDRKSGVALISDIFDPPACSSIALDGLEKMGHEMEVPAARDIAMALFDDFPEQVSELTCSYPNMIFKHCNNQVEFLNYVKWALRVETFRKWENKTKLYQAYVGNSCVSNGLKSYTIYWYHCHKDVRPGKGWADLAIQQIFKDIYGQNHKQEYAKYQKLLDAAYPLNK